MASASGKASTARSMLASRSRCSVGYGARLVQLVTSSASVPANWNCGWKLAICSSPCSLSLRSSLSARGKKALKSRKLGKNPGAISSVVSRASGDAATSACNSCASSPSSCCASVALLTTEWIWPLACTPLANGHRFRPMTARSSQRSVSCSTAPSTPAPVPAMAEASPALTPATVKEGGEEKDMAHRR